MKPANEGLRLFYIAVLFAVLTVDSLVHAVQDREQHSLSLRVAVATNFAPALNAIAEEFTESTNIELSVVTGSTGKLYAQIKNGMNVDVFLSADQVRIARLVEEGMTINDTLTTYAEGRIVWWHPDSNQSIDWRTKLEFTQDVKVVAHAQPELAPYGLAAVQALSRCFDIDRSLVKFVQGENVGQTYAHVVTRNADAGFVALASIRQASTVPLGSYSRVPRTCHEPIRQDAVVLKSSRNLTAATQFLEFLQNDRTQRRIAEFGYEAP